MGTGYSVAANGSASIPTDEMGVAVHAYSALQQFFTQHRRLQSRPLFITGEVSRTAWILVACTVAAINNFAQC